MDPSSKNKQLLKAKLRAKLKKKTKLRLVKSLDKSPDTITAVPDETLPVVKEVVKETTLKPKARIIFDEDEPAAPPVTPPTAERPPKSVTPKTTSATPLTLKVAPKSTKAVLVTDAVKKDLDTKMLVEDVKPLEFTEKSTFYKYEPDLNTNMDELSVIEPGEKFYICAYRIDNTGLKPFIQYCFHKDKGDLMSFPVLKNTGKKPIDKQGSDFIQYIFKESPECSFFLRIRKGHNYLFYNVSMKPKEHAQFLKKKTQWWWALMTEIVNYKQLMNFQFNSNIYPIFMNNPSLIYLKDKDENIIEIPEVGFHGTYFGLLDLISTYGLRPSTLYAMMGPYFYFGTFRKAVRYAGWTSTYKSREIDGKVVADEEGRYERGGIARFAIFLGKMKAFLNQPNERNDFSELVEKRIKQDPRSKKWEELTIKLHDHNGKWAEDYDSCYIGRVKLANGGLFMKNPEFILKHFEQQHILTIHELDTSTLKAKWDGNYTGYNIL